MRVHEYALMRDVVASQLRPRGPQNMYKAPPLLVMNNFSAADHLKLVVELFRSMFPPLNAQTVKLASCQARPPAAALVAREFGSVCA